MNIGIFNQSAADRRETILHTSAVPAILLFSLPALAIGLVQALMTVIDGLFINNAVGTVAASAVTYCAPVILLLAAGAQGIGMAGMSAIGQMNVQGEFSQAKYIASQVMVYAFLLGCVTAPFLFILSFPLSSKVNPEISGDVFLYLSLNALVLPFSYIEAAYNAIKDSTGGQKSTFIRMSFLLLLKVLFNFLFIVLIPLGIVGAVLASFFANLFIAIWLYYEMFLKISDDRLELRGFNLNKDVARGLFHAGMPALFNSVILNFGFFLINSEVENYGPVALNGHGIACSIAALCFTVPTALGAAVTTVVSMHTASQNGRKAFGACTAGCLISLVSAAVLIAVVVPLGPFLTMLFTRQQDVLAVANRALAIYICSALGYGVYIAELGAFVGFGRASTPFIMEILRIWLLRYIFILLTERFFGVYAVFWGYFFSNFAAAGITTVLFLRLRRASFLPAKPKPAE